MGNAKVLAEALRKVGQWHGLGIDAQAVAILTLPEVKEAFISATLSPPKSPNPISYEAKEPELEDCNEDGECWRFNAGCKGYSSPFLIHDSWVLSSRKIGTHWLPYNTPSLPANFKG